MSTRVINTLVLTLLLVLFEKGVLTKEDGERIIQTAMNEARKQLLGF